jgi:hypothetical protein
MLFFPMFGDGKGPRLLPWSGSLPWWLAVKPEGRFSTVFCRLEFTLKTYLCQCNRWNVAACLLLFLLVLLIIVSVVNLSVYAPYYLLIHDMWGSHE